MWCVVVGGTIRRRRICVRDSSDNPLKLTVQTIFSKRYIDRLLAIVFTRRMDCLDDSTADTHPIWHAYRVSSTNHGLALLALRDLLHLSTTSYPTILDTVAQSDHVTPFIKRAWKTLITGNANRDSVENSVIILQMMHDALSEVVRKALQSFIAKESSTEDQSNDWYRKVFHASEVDVPSQKCGDRFSCSECLILHR